MYGRPRPPKPPRMGWEAEILSAYPQVLSFAAGPPFEGPRSEQQARDWVESAIHGLISYEVPRTKIAGYIRYGQIVKIDGKEKLDIMSIRTSIRYAADDSGTLRWEDPPVEVASSPVIV